jgi:hypothetical protein
MLRHGGLAVNPLIHPWFRHLRPWVGVAIAPILMGLSGCRPKDWVHGLPQNDALRGQIFVLVGLSPDERFDSHTRKDAERRLAILLEGFQSIHPQVRVQVQTLPASDLIDVLSRRNRAGLSPDVVIVRGEAAMALQQKHLIQPQFEGSVRPGEKLSIDGEACEVRYQNLRATTLWRECDNAELVIPNRTFFSNTTITYTRGDPFRRCEVRVPVPPDLNPAEIMVLMEKSASSIDGVLRDPPPRTLLLKIGDATSSVSSIYALRFMINDPINQPEISSAVQAAIWQILSAKGLASLRSDPVPQIVDVRVTEIAGSQTTAPNQ